MLLMAETGIRGVICHAIHRYATANNKYMEIYNKNKELSYLMHLDANNYMNGQCLKNYQSIALNGKNTSKFNEKFIKNYDEESDKGYVLEVDIEYSKILHDLHIDLPFLPERIKIKKCNELVCNLYEKNNYVTHIRTLKQALNHGIILKRFHKIIQFNQKPWLKPYIDMNTELRTEARNDFEKDLFMLTNNSVFGITLENVRKDRNNR